MDSDESGLTTQSSEDLMQLYQSGNKEAFRVLYERHSPQVFGFLLRKLKNQTAAEDALQACFVKLHTSRLHYDPKYPLTPWLFVLCRGAMIDQIRSERRHQEGRMADFPEDLQIETPSSQLPEIDFSKLTKIQRQAVDLRYYEDLSFEDIAKRIETSPLNVRKIVSRALHILRGSK
jgi:RNA polymerase sigma-70 factor (ECF subfamily)